MVVDSRGWEAATGDYWALACGVHSGCMSHAGLGCCTVLRDHTSRLRESNSCASCAASRCHRSNHCSHLLLFFTIVSTTNPSDEVSRPATWRGLQRRCPSQCPAHGRRWHVDSRDRCPTTYFEWTPPPVERAARRSFSSWGNPRQIPILRQSSHAYHRFTADNAQSVSVDRRCSDDHRILIPRVR